MEFKKYYLYILGWFDMNNNSKFANTNNEADKELSIYQWFRLILTLISVPFFLFICAKDIGWWQAWIVSGLFVSAALGGRIWAEIRHREFWRNVIHIIQDQL